MTLGSIFSKLSGIKLRSIAKWYGIAVMSVVLLVIFIFFAAAVGSIVIQIATALGFWGTLIVVGVALAGFCVNYFWDEIFPDEDDIYERHMRNVMLHGTEYKAAESPYNFSYIADNQTWLRVEEAIAGMKDGETCDIHAPDGTVYHCENQAEALKLFNELWAARKTE